MTSCPVQPRYMPDYALNKDKIAKEIGPNSNATVTMIWNYAGIGCKYISPVQGIGAYAKSICQLGYVDLACFFLGVNKTLCLSSNRFQEPNYFGLDVRWPVDFTFAKDDPHIAGILWADYPSQVGGVAVADSLFGAANPGGKQAIFCFGRHCCTTEIPQSLNDYSNVSFQDII